MTKKPQGEPHYRVPRELADSPAFRDMPSAAKHLWHDMMMFYRGRNNGNINATLTALRPYGWRSTATLAKAIAHLMAYGFLRETRKGGGNSCPLNQCCLYRFTHLPTNGYDDIGLKSGPATYEYRVFDPRKLPKSITLTSLKNLSENKLRFKIRRDEIRKLKQQALGNEDQIISALQQMKPEKSA